jgi:HK97 family phage prohead protease
VRVKFSQTLIIRRISSAETGDFTGLASTWNRDRHGDIIRRGAFSSSITALKSGTRRVPLLSNHDTNTQIGTISDAEETDAGLAVSGKLVLGTPAADRAHSLMKADALGLSVGFLPIDDPDDDEDGKIYGSVDLVEVSAVAVPSNRESRVLTVKSLAEASPTDIERLLRDGDLPEMPRRLAAKLARAFHAVLDDDDDDDDPSELLAALDRLKQLHTLSRK